jgi:hypothetical protein
MRPRIHPLADTRLAYSQRTGMAVLGAAPSLLAPRLHTATPTARDPGIGRQWQPRHA